MALNKRNNPLCELRIGDVKTKSIQKFNYLGSTVKDDRNHCIADNAFMKLSIVLRDREIFLETKKRS